MCWALVGHRFRQFRATLVGYNYLASAKAMNDVGTSPMRHWGRHRVEAIRNALEGNELCVSFEETPDGKLFCIIVYG